MDDWKNAKTGAPYGVGDVMREATQEAQLLKLERLVVSIRNEPETGYEKLQELKRHVEHLLACWNNPPSA